MAAQINKTIMYTIYNEFVTGVDATLNIYALSIYCRNHTRKTYFLIHLTYSVTPTIQLN